MSKNLKIHLKRVGIIGQFGWLFALFSAHAASLEVVVGNARADGTFYAALHAPSPQGWQATAVAQASSAQPRLQFADLPPGRYALQLFQDINGNGQLDQSRRGLPREPVGLSGNPPLQQGRPELDACLFEVHEGSNRIDIRLVQPGRRALRAAAN